MTAKIISVISNAPMQNWLSCLEYFEDFANSKTFGKKDCSYIANELANALQNKKINHACNWLSLGLTLNSDLFIKTLRKNGALRPSKYDFEISILPKVINKVASKIPISSTIEKYFSSLKHLCFSASEIQILRNSLIADLKRGREKLLREILILVDTAFMLQATRGYFPKREGETQDITFFSPEMLAEAAGYTLFLYSSNVGEFGQLDIELDITRINIDKLLINSAKIRAFCEFEVMIVALPHKRF